MISFQSDLKRIEQALHENAFTQEPINLYQPIQYILTLGGKHIRPLFALTCYELYHDDYQKIINPALAVEFFHNFTLMHDDIMDKASLRRGKPTVHTQWNLNTALLSGDALMIVAYQYFEGLEAELFSKIVPQFSKMALQVCEGQQLDIDFETSENVTIDQYLEMITLKTAVLIAFASKMGALIGGASDENANNLYEFAKNLGIAFQIQDDYLDVYGNTEKVGKKHAGDIYENKKTILYLKALEKASPEQKNILQHWYSTTEENLEKVQAVTQIFNDLDIPSETKKAIEKYHQTALHYLEKVETSQSKEKLFKIAEYLIQREL